MPLKTVRFMASAMTKCQIRGMSYYCELALNKTPEAKKCPSAPAIWIIWTSATCAPPVPTTQGGCDTGCS